MILFVSYDLKGKRDYVPFYEALKQQGVWWHYLSYTWLLSTSKSPQDVTEALRPYMDANDSLLVAEMGQRYQGYLPKPAWEWIHDRLGESSRMAAGLAVLAGMHTAPNPLLTPPESTQADKTRLADGIQRIRDRDKK